jgi:hypothetical protein
MFPIYLSMVFGPNDSPLSGRAGKAVTGRAIGERLEAEAETSVSLRVSQLPGEGVNLLNDALFPIMPVSACLLEACGICCCLLFESLFMR